MRTVSALKIKNDLGGVLDSLEKDGEPILLSKGKKIKAVLITPEAFKEKFLDKPVNRDQEKLIEKIRMLRADSVVKEDSTHVLRVLRGYEE